MITLGVYLLFVSALAGYRSSKYFPNQIKVLPWLGKVWWSWGTGILGTIVLLAEKGFTIGILLSLCAYMAFSCCIIFFASANSWFRSSALVLFHAICVLGFILKF